MCVEGRRNSRFLCRWLGSFLVGVGSGRVSSHWLIDVTYFAYLMMIILIELSAHEFWHWPSDDVFYPARPCFLPQATDHTWNAHPATGQHFPCRINPQEGPVWGSSRARFAAV